MRGLAVEALALVNVTSLADDRRQVGVEGEQELLDVAPGPIGIEQREAGVDLRRKHDRGEEAE